VESGRREARTSKKGKGERKLRDFSLVDWILRFCGGKEEQPEEMFPPGLIHHRPDGPAPGDAPPRSGPGGGPSLVLTADPKPRLRWTADLHERFVDAVAQLGGPESERLLPAPRLFNLDALRFLSSALESNAWSLVGTSVGFARWSSRGWILAPCAAGCCFTVRERGLGASTGDAYAEFFFLEKATPRLYNKNNQAF
jgi:hypothetical protein